MRNRSTPRTCPGLPSPSSQSYLQRITTRFPKPKASSILMCAWVDWAKTLCTDWGHSGKTSGNNYSSLSCCDKPHITESTANQTGVEAQEWIYTLGFIEHPCAPGKIS